MVGEDEMRENYNRVYEGIREGKPVKLKHCPQCGLEGVVSAGSDSDFPMYNKYGKLVPRHLCFVCKRKYEAQRHRERLSTDPAYRKRVRRQSKEAKARWAKRYPERAKAARDNWVAKQREKDPEYFREYARMRWALNKEREGKPVRHRSTVIDGTQPRVTREPFTRWLAAYQARSRFNPEELGFDLGIDPRQVRSVLNREYERVSQDLVDTALLNARFLVELDGKLIVTLDDLFGERQAEEGNFHGAKANAA